MSVVGSDSVRMGASGSASYGYEIANSIRMSEDTSDWLYRTPGGAGNQKTFTIHACAKFGVLSGADDNIFYTGAGSVSNLTMFGLYRNGTTGKMHIFCYDNGSLYINLASNEVFRDSASHNDIHLQVDTTQVTDTDRVTLTVNGKVVTWGTASFPSLNRDCYVNSTAQHNIGRYGGNGYRYGSDFHLSEFHIVDGASLAPFGEYDVLSPDMWRVADAVVPAYGTNGVFLDFENGVALGNDVSGEGNDWTVSGSPVQTEDTPTNNYATLNSLWSAPSFPVTFDNGNTKAGRASGSSGGTHSTYGRTTGKHYAEFTCDAVGTASLCRVGAFGLDNLTDALMFSSSQYAPQLNSVLYLANGTLRTYLPSYADTTSWGDTYTTADIIGVAYDADSGKVWFSKNGSWQASGDPAAGTSPAATLTTGEAFWFTLQLFNSTWSANFGATAFDYTPPTDFVALSSRNFADLTIVDGAAHFQTTLYTGNGTSIGSGGNAVSQIENSTFQPDFVWIKRRNAAVEHALTDAVRGVTKELSSNDTGAEETVAEGLTTFGTDGFTVGSDGSYNTNTATYAAWQWLAGNGTSANTDGTISSTVSVNDAAGFSIVEAASMTGAVDTVGHGQSAAPEFVIGRMQAETFDWQTWHTDLTSGAHSMKLNTTAAQASATSVYPSAPSATVLNVGGAWTNTNPAIFYCWRSIPGYSKFGSFTGNGSTNGSFIYTGFTPAFVMIKRADSTSGWNIFDIQREGYNVDNDQLVANTTAAETTTDYLDLLSGGFKLRSTSTEVNASGGTYIYAAFAKYPIGGRLTPPAPAQ